MTSPQPRPASPTHPFEPAELASWPTRLAAWAIDGIAFGVVFVAGALMVAVQGDGEASFRSGEDGFALGIWYFAAAVAWDIAWIAGPPRGKPGQRAMGLRVVRANGSRVGLRHAAVRGVVRALSVPLSFIPGTGLLILASAATIAATPRRQAVHDLAAGTVCVSSAAVDRVTGPQATTSSVRSTDLLDPDRHSGPFL